MELVTYFSDILPFVPFFPLFMFHVFIRSKLSLVWTLSYIIGFVLFVLVISVVIFSIYRFQLVFPCLYILPCIIIYSVFHLLHSAHGDLGGYHWLEICLILIVVFCVGQYITNWYMVSKVRRIRRECSLLDAVCNDISKALQDGRGDTGRQTSTLSPETIRLPLPKSQIEDLEQWVKQTKGTVNNAKWLIGDFASRTQHFLSRQRLFLHLNKVVSISNDLSQHIGSACVQGFYSALKDWRFMSQSRDVIEDESGYARPGELAKQVAAIIKEETINLSEDRKKKIELKLLLLEAFLKDLSPVKLECEIEKAWLGEMKLFLDDIQIALETFGQRDKGLGLHRLLGKKLLDRDVGWMADGLTELLEEKKKLGFKFTIIQQQTHLGQNDVKNEDVILLSVIRKISAHPFNQRIDIFTQVKADAPAPAEAHELALERAQSQTEALANELAQALRAQAQTDALANELAQARAESEAYRQTQAQAKAQPQVEVEGDPEIMSLCKKLENMYWHLKAMHSATSFRLVGLEQMNEIGKGLEKAFQNYIERTFPLKLETSIIDSPIKDLERFIQALDSKVRRKHSSVIGLEEDTDALISKLTDTAGIEQCCVFLIVGMQGIGKSTLAMEVYLHNQISRHFRTLRWVSVPNIPNNNDGLLENVGNQIITTNASQHEQEEGEIEEHYSQKIHNFLKQERYLVVLDDVPTMEVWNVIKVLFPEGRNGSRILLTTRDLTLASHVHQNNELHQLRLRTKEESWELFLEKAQLSPEHFSQNEMLKKTKKVVERCCGLPSLISFAGTLTSGNALDFPLLSTVSMQVVDQRQNLWSETSHINGLSDDLRSFISYFALFPKNYEIPARRFLASWAAEGLLQQSGRETITSENIADDCLSKLMGVNIIQPMEKSIHGKVRTCLCPDVLLPLSKSTFSVKRRLADHCDTNDAGSDLIHGAEHPVNGWSYYGNLISFISFDFRNGYKPGKDIGNFLHEGIANGRFKELKVLDLERVFRPQLPEIIDKLTELRYLGLRWTFLEKIPSTVGKLSKLQTLDLKHTGIHTLPFTIWKLQELRHLYLSQTYRSKFVHRSKTKPLDNLQTLCGVFLDENSHLKDRLDEMKSLRKLGLTFRLSSRQQEELARGISKLKRLQSLRLKSIGVRNEPLELSLGNFKELESLSNIYLFGKLKENELHLSKFPNALSDLTLSSSGLENDPMPILEKLCNLKSLCLFSDSFTREDMVCSREGFRQLLVLRMWKLGGLTNWTIEEEAMQNLKELEIRSCPKLNVPDGLRHLKTLRQLKLSNMSAAFSERCSAFVPLSIIDTKTLCRQD